MAEKYRHLVEGYMINPEGKVFSAKSGKILKQFPNNKGYMRFQVYSRSSRKWYFTHISVVKVFGDRKGQRLLEEKTLTEMGWSIDHIDGDKTNNNRKNLQIVTHGENVRRYYHKKKRNDRENID